VDVLTRGPRPFCSRVGTTSSFHEPDRVAPPRRWGAGRALDQNPRPPASVVALSITGRSRIRNSDPGGGGGKRVREGAELSRRKKSRFAGAGKSRGAATAPGTTGRGDGILPGQTPRPAGAEGFRGGGLGGSGRGGRKTMKNDAVSQGRVSRLSDMEKPAVRGAFFGKARGRGFSNEAPNRENGGPFGRASPARAHILAGA